ncbi:ATP-binding protein [Pelotomaculum propionicicum]|uniref:Ferredoxin-1 n=1 Tax=Pelotomaculum propionicicum TaxID=258475 RepID=A0A4Y7RXM9_9FIRM|nr:4Fe-4S binding protein [Pelotomaculum propionicicum]NLI13564.1 4Fe-4S binding protein [Peptococcaceae bacterium]TEB13755.1 Ferredoxin-1 [Pelotomaculum propionicicum]
MIRKIVRIDREKCDGCGLCVEACHEGALQLINGKAELVSESYCDGLGACLPECPAGAITIEEREADAFDEESVKKHMAEHQKPVAEKLACGCPGAQARAIERKETAAPAQGFAPAASQLRQWPCQIKLAPVNAPYFDHAHLLVAADCTAYAYANVHNEFMRNKITLIGCPKLDNVDYAEKLTGILQAHEIKSFTVLRMEVPCCGGIVNAVKQALTNSGKMIPWRVVTVTTDGRIAED